MAKHQTENRDNPAPHKGLQRRPLKMRIFLLVVVLILAGIAFYLSNLITIEQIQNR